MKKDEYAKAVKGSLDPLVVTNGDRVLCRDCYEEEHSELDPTTHFFSTIHHGICNSCGLEVKKANVESEVSE